MKRYNVTVGYRLLYAATIEVEADAPMYAAQLALEQVARNDEGIVFEESATASRGFPMVLNCEELPKWLKTSPPSSTPSSTP